MASGWCWRQTRETLSSWMWRPAYGSGSTQRRRMRPSRGRSTANVFSSPSTVMSMPLRSTAGRRGSSRDSARPEVVGLFDPQSSSDGKWIAFVADGVNQFVGLYAVRSDGAELHLIARDAQSFAWSPTGERLAFAGHRGVSLIDVANGRRRRLTNDHLDDPANEGPTWSPDGRRILYRRNDLGYGAVPGYHMQLWTMKVDGTDRHPQTRDFAPDLGTSVAWVDAESKGTRAPRLPVVAIPAARSITTSLPIVALAAEGKRAAVAQGFGGLPGLRGPLGPIVVWSQGRESRVQIPVRGCGTADDVLLAAGRVGYVCGNPGEAY